MPSKPARKFTALNNRLFDYLCDCSRCNEDKILAELRRETARLGEVSVMQIGPDQGAFMTLLTRAIGARSAIEVGSFTGYSSICLARGLPETGKLHCLDASAEWTAIARKYWKRAKLDHKIELRLGPAIESLKRLPASRMFDIAFIDALKTEYADYYRLVLPHIRPNGLILFDNMFAGGGVGRKSNASANARALDQLNRLLARDPRVEPVLLSIGDGLSLCRVRGR